MTPLYLSTGAFQSKQLADILELAKSNQLSAVELSSGVAFAENIDAVLAQELPNFQFLVHNYFPPPAEPFVLNLASPDKAIFEASMDLCRLGIDMTARFGAPYYSVHAGFCFYLTPEMLGDPVTQATVSDEFYIPKEEAYAIFLNSVESLAAYAADKGVDLLIENNVVSPKYLAGGENLGLLLAEPEEMTRFMGDVNAPNVRILMDVAHLAVSATAIGFDPKAALDEVRPHVGALHLSDNNGIVDNNQPIRTSSWFCDMLHDFKDLVWVIEVYNLTLNDINQQISLLESLRQ